MPRGVRPRGGDAEHADGHFGSRDRDHAAPSGAASLSPSSSRRLSISTKMSPRRKASLSKRRRPTSSGSMSIGRGSTGHRQPARQRAEIHAGWREGRHRDQRDERRGDPQRARHRHRHPSGRAPTHLGAPLPRRQEPLRTRPRPRPEPRQSHRRSPSAGALRSKSNPAKAAISSSISLLPPNLSQL